MKKIIRFFDKFEDHVREMLSKFPVIYSLIGGIAIVVFWRGIWEIFDAIEIFGGLSGGLLSLAISTIILLASGLFVSFFIGDTILMSGLKHEKKVTEKNMEELKKDTEMIQQAFLKIESIEKHLAEIKEKIR